MFDVLFVEDNREIQEVNKNMLMRCGGYGERLAYSLAEARDCLAVSRPDIIVLDIILPDGNGLGFLKELRRDGVNIPILLLSGMSEPEEVVAGLRAGGDDYLTKPYLNDELLARIEVLLRRVPLLPEVLERGRLSLDTTLGRAFVGDRQLHLTQKEFAVLLLLAHNEGKTLNAEDIYKKIWGLPAYNKETLKKRVYSLRQKLEDELCDCEIENVWGEGYCFTQMKREK